MNNKHCIILFSLFALGCVSGACSLNVQDQEESVGVTSAALSLPGLTPQPHKWFGSPVDLMFADAFVSCSWQNDSAVGDSNTTTDVYTQTVLALMVMANCTDGALNADPTSDPLFLSAAGRWYMQRKEPLCNSPANPSDLSSAKFVLLEKHKIPQQVIAGSVVAGTAGVPVAQAGTTSAALTNYATSITAATSILRAPSLNLCIAQQLRAQAPGTAGAEALLMSTADQRQLLEVTRQRAQIAMIGFAQLGVLFAQPSQVIASTSYSAVMPLPMVTAWGQHANNQSILAGMGTDFSAAVQLHAIVSKETVELLARSSNSGEPRGGHATAAAEEMWGPGAWRQRALASLFGGDSLAGEPGLDGLTPWEPVAGSTSPDQAVPAYTNLTWPDRWQQPFVRTDMHRPEPRSLLAIARAYDVLDVKGSLSQVANGCYSIDRTSTARQLYEASEVALENNACVLKSSVDGACLPVAIGDLPPTCHAFSSTSPDYSGCLLWTIHGITPEHASLTASYVADIFEPVCKTPGTLNFGSGARNLARGSIAVSSVGGGIPENMWYHISSDATLVERGPAEIQPLYGRYSHFYMAPSTFPWSSPDSQGYPTYAPSTATPSTSDEAKRYLGSSAALIATQQAVLDADVASPAAAQSTIATYLKQKKQILDVATSAVGDMTVTIRPMLTAGSTGAPAQVTTVFGVPYWTVIVTAPAGNSAWITGGPNKTLRVILDDPNAAALVSYPTTAMFGRTASTVLAAAATVAGGLTPMTPKNGYNRFRADFPVPASGSHHLTLVASAPGANASGVGGPSPGTPSVVLAANVFIVNITDTKLGFYLGQHGSLGLTAERMFYGLPDNPSKPAFDGFGFPTDWVPPTNPNLFNDPAGGDAATHYLNRAKEAAGDATAAVQQAFDTLLQQASSAAAESAVQQKSTLLLQQETGALCGAGNASCDTTLVSTAVLNVQGPTCANPQSTATSDVVDCITALLMRDAAAPLLIANAVAAHLKDPSVPAFSAYGGGRLQAMFIEQWGAVQRLNDISSEIVFARAAADAHVAQVDAELANYFDETKKNCSAGRMFAAIAAGSSVSAGFPAGVSGSFTPGPLIAQKQKCTDLKDKQPLVVAAHAAALADIIAAMAGHAARLHDVLTVIAASSANMQFEMANTGRAKAQAALESTLAAAGQQTSFGIYRSYHNYDLWRAKALLEDARRFSVAARRAIEAKYIVDLSTMNSPEAFVAAPSSWADQIYDNDLSLPAAVGLSVGTANASGIYSNKILDYVGNLQRFVDGYAVNRPSAAALGDSDVITLLGPDSVLMSPLPGSIPGHPDTMRYAWSYFCPADASWVGLPQVADPGNPGGPQVAGKADLACGGLAPKPTKARLVFSLDAWGRVDAYGVQAPPSKRYNVRWSRLAINLVGTGIKDCSQAYDPLGCYSSSFVPYNLTHVGPSWVTDYEGSWNTLGIPIGQVNQAKALAAEQWLNPITNGWSAAYVQAVERHEFAERPLDGVYQLELDVAPEVQLGQIDRVQVLADTSYWVRQN